LTEKEAIYCELLVLRCRRGQKDALEEVVRTWERRLFYYVRRLVGDEQEAWQILQDTWLKVLRGIGSLREPRNLPAWLYGIARNTAFSHLRARHAEESLLTSQADAADAAQTGPDLEFEDAERVQYGLGRISLEHRDVLTLFFLQDLSIEQIAGVVNVPEGTVKSRIYHAKRALKKILEAREQ
jgi:RNA polymerase sigma-70 factor, ECF subfamily